MYTFKNRISEGQIQDCNSIFVRNINNIGCDYVDCSGRGFEKALDILMIADITRARMLYFYNSDKIKKFIKFPTGLNNLKMELPNIAKIMEGPS